MKIANTYLIALFFVMGLSISCTEKQDFDQIEDLEVIPSVEASLFYFESPESLINLFAGSDFFIRTFTFDAFSESFFEQNVLDGTITYQIENTTSKPLEVIIEFLDGGGNSLDSESFTVGSAPTAIIERQISYGTLTGRNIDIIKSTTDIKVSARNLGDNSSVSSDPEPKVILRSSAKFRLQLIK